MALENARLYEDARKLADRDPLTGFYNHRFLHERLGEEVVRAQRGRRPLSVLMLDLDDFKLVNDTFGHLFGDRVLTWTAELIRSTLRASDIPARYGGDEFAIILPETDADEARRAAERILERVPRATRSSASSAARSRSRASIGVATFPADGRTGDRAHRRRRPGALPGQARRRPRRRRWRATPPPDGRTGRPVRKYQATMTRRYWPRAMDATASGPPSSIPDVSQPHRSIGRSPGIRRIVGSAGPGGSSPAPSSSSAFIAVVAPRRRTPSARLASSWSSCRRRRLRRDPPPPGRRAPSRSAGAPRPSPSPGSCRACRAPSRPTRSSRRSSTSWPTRPAPTTSSSPGAGRTRASSRRRWSAPGRASPTRRRSCPSATSRIPIEPGRRAADGREPVAIPAVAVQPASDRFAASVGSRGRFDRPHRRGVARGVHRRGRLATTRRSFARPACPVSGQRIADRIAARARGTTA